MDEERILEVVQYLIGEVKPTGDSATDMKRLENARKLTSLMRDLYNEISEIAKRYDDSPYASERAIANECIDCLHSIYMDLDNKLV